MCRRLFLAVTAIIIAAPLARAQTSTADGVDAFVHGDYQRAADILKPIAERPWQPDHVAEFFMAALYETGLGVPTDPLRACALYVRASESDATPLGVQAMTLVRTRQESLGRERFEDCTFLAGIGLNHRFQPVTFVLDQGHWIAWDLKGATITYEGKEKRHETPLASNGAMFLPLQHTELTVGAMRSMRRHFIEVFLWMPLQDFYKWTLMWHLFEVVRDELIPIAAENTVTVSAPEPPAGPPFDVRDVVRLRVNDAGDPEWSVLQGATPHSGVIESDADRKEEQQRVLARNAAEANVDWTRIRDIHRPPGLAYADAAGCGHVFVFGWTDDRTEAVTVRADKDLLQLSTTAQTFDLAALSGALELAVHVYARPVHSWPFCTDAPTFLPEEAWRATRGTVTIELSPPSLNAREPSLYRATIRIVGAEFVNASGVRVTQVHPITLSAIVGRMFG